MRLKSADGPLAIHNGNGADILNSPKRINTLQNSNVVTSYTAVIATGGDGLTGGLNNINGAQEKVQWCTRRHTQVNDNYNNNNNNNRNNNNNTRSQLHNINNALAAQIQTVRRAPAAPFRRSPDSLPEPEDAAQGASSPEASPQDEERAFDCSDSELSDDGNLVDIRGGIVNPNYPGFQHLAEALAFRQRSGGELTDEDLEIDDNSLNNNNNNNNNNNIIVDDDSCHYDKIDSVNRLDSVENIQKVFYDKPAFDIDEGDRSSSCDSDPSTRQTSEDDAEANVSLDLATPAEEGSPLVGDFREENGHQFRRISFSLSTAKQGNCDCADVCVGQLRVAPPPAQRPAIKYNIEPQPPQDGGRLSQDGPIVLQDSRTIRMGPPAPGEGALTVKLHDAFLSGAGEALPPVKEDLFVRDSNRALEEIEHRIRKIGGGAADEGCEKFAQEAAGRGPKEGGGGEGRLRGRRDSNLQVGSLITFPRRDSGTSRRSGRRAAPAARRRQSPEVLGSFDVYNIETAMPKIDLEAIEAHLRAAREEERRRRTDREEIRRRLAMGPDDDYYTDRPGRKPSLQARLQSGMNLQICFMNETASDTESPNSDSEGPVVSPVKEAKTAGHPTRPATLPLGQPQLQLAPQSMVETDFFARQARLQTEARMALAQAKEMARMQMEIERQRQKKSPITEMVRHSLEKVGIPFPEEKRRLSRQILTEMNVAQLQVIVNDLHTQIETLNESLVKFLMERDDLHMGQDSMLVDIEDLTRYLGAKEQVLKEQNFCLTPQNNNVPPPSPAPSSPLSLLNNSMKPHLHRIANLVKK